MRAPGILFSGWFVGVATTLAQLTLIRELSQWFCGNDIFLGWTLAVWVGGTAWGAGVLFQAFKRTQGPPSAKSRIVLGSLHFLVLTGTLLLTRTLDHFIPWSTASGQTLSHMLLWVLVLSLPLATSGGLWFASLFPSETPTPHAPHNFVADSALSIVLWEALGSTCAGGVYTFLLSPHWNPWALLAGLSFLWAVYALFTSTSSRWRAGSSGMLALILVLTVWPGWHVFNQHSMPRQPEAGRVLSAGNTRQGSVTVYQQQQTYSLYVQNQCRFSFPWPEHHEPQALLTWLWGTPPKRIALIGAHPDFIRAILEQPDVEVLTVLSPDPEADTWFQQHLPRAWKSTFSDPRLRFISSDARNFFTTQTSTQFERIILALPLPETLALNRFYTLEFMTLLRARLAPQGIVDYILPYSENVRLVSELALLRSLLSNLSRTFPTTHLWAGGYLHLLGSADLHPETFLPPIAWPSHLHSSVLTPRQFPFLFDSVRSTALLRECSQGRRPPANTDMRPLATGYSLGHWLAQQSQALLSILLFGLLGVALFTFRRMRFRTWHSPLLRMGLAGGLGLSTEWIVLAAFQSRRGVIWGELGILLSAFMAGMALGTWASQHAWLKRISSYGYLLILGILCALSGFIVYGTYGAWLPTLLLLGGSGGGVGAMFARLQREPAAAHASAYWSADLAGSAVSAGLTIMVLLPCFGFHAGWILVLLIGVSASTLTLWKRLAQKPGL